MASTLHRALSPIINGLPRRPVGLLAMTYIVIASVAKQSISLKSRDFSQFIIFRIVIVAVRADSENSFILCLQLEFNHLFECIHHRLRINALVAKSVFLHFFNQIVTAFNGRNIFRAWFVFEGENRTIITIKRKAWQFQKKGIMLDELTFTEPGSVQNQNK